MRTRDETIKRQLEFILKARFTGRDLIVYFDCMPEKMLRRAITLFSEVYPSETVISDEQFGFIGYMLSTNKMVEQESFSNFIISISTINYSIEQKEKLVNITKDNIFSLCNGLTFEFDNFLSLLLNQEQLADYVKWMADIEDEAVLMRAMGILQYERFDRVPVEIIESLKQTIKNKLK